jgi:hypothetical protein
VVVVVATTSLASPHIRDAMRARRPTALAANQGGRQRIPNHGDLLLYLIIGHWLCLLNPASLEQADEHQPDEPEESPCLRK